MTAFALKTANQRCGVSQLHGKVTRKMWHILWPELPEEQVPISHVTNGVHVPTWIAPELYSLFQKYLGKDWMRAHDDAALWDGDNLEYYYVGGREAVPRQEKIQLEVPTDNSTLTSIREIVVRICQEAGDWGFYLEREVKPKFDN